MRKECCIAVLKMNKGVSIMCLMLFLLVAVADSAGATYIVSEYERGELLIVISVMVMSI